MTLTRRGLLAQSLLALGAAACFSPAKAQDNDPIADLEAKARSSDLPIAASSGARTLGPQQQQSFTARVDRLLAVQDTASSSVGRAMAGPQTASALRREASRLLIAVHRAENSVARDLQPARFQFTYDERLKAEYRNLFATVTVRPERATQVSIMGNRFLNRDRRRLYDKVAAKTGVPWYVVGLIHCMEASFNTGAHLHNGDPLDSRTVQVPEGRPEIWDPPTDWASSAIDALRYDKLAENADWSLERTLYLLERYNGTGTRRRGLPTPYLWSFSNHYTKGKFVRDGVWDPDAVSQQIGAAVLLKWLILDESVFLPGMEPEE